MTRQGLAASPTRRSGSLAITITIAVGAGLAVSAALAGCGAPLPGDGSEGGAGPASVGSVSQALGETILGRPNYQERLALYMCNKSRVEPATSAENDWSEYPAVPPLLWHDNLAEAARAHSEDMRDTPCFQHNSCDGTDPFERMKSFWRGAPAATMGENIMAGINDGKTAIFNWIEEIGAPPGERGHRDNMFSKDFTHVGFGYLTGGTRFQGYWTQDFAGINGTKFPALTSGSDWDSKQAQLNRTFGTVYYSAAGTAPDRVLVVIDGKARPLQLAKGKPSMGAYEANLSVEAGCHRYYFSAFVGGVESTYPSAGTLAVDADNAGGSCPAYAAGKVGGVDLPVVPPGGGTDGSDEGGCRVGGGGSSRNLGDALLVALLPLASRLRRRRRPAARA